MTSNTELKLIRLGQSDQIARTPGPSWAVQVGTATSRPALFRFSNSAIEVVAHCVSVGRMNKKKICEAESPEFYRYRGEGLLSLAVAA